MSEKLFKIPVVDWVRETIKKMNSAHRQDIKTWRNHWIQSYKDLGGKRCKDLTGRDGSGDKECPMHAAYGLWRLGRIRDCGLPIANLPLTKVQEEYGPNAAYAVLALDLLEHKPKRASRPTDLWASIQDRYCQEFGENAATSEQGAVRIAVGLFNEDQIESANR